VGKPASQYFSDPGQAALRIEVECRWAWLGQNVSSTTEILNQILAPGGPFGAEGVGDPVTIKDLGRWESLEMVQRYTKSVTFEDALRFCRAPLG
jgi:hypothetical protein